MIKPTIGRVVLFHPANSFEGAFESGKPLPALVSHVWSDTCINIGGFDSNGKPFSATSVFLVQDDAAKPDAYFAEWMPYQKAQAEKHADKKPDAGNVTDLSIEREIQAKGKTAARVTSADIEASIRCEHYFTASDGNLGAFSRGKSVPQAEYLELSLLTFCVLVLQNGFTVTGESACASPENFDEEIGRKIARQNAINKIWPLMGYALKEKLAR